MKEEKAPCHLMDVFVGRLSRSLHLTQSRSHLGMFLWVTATFQEAPHHPAALSDEDRFRQQHCAREGR